MEEYRNIHMADQTSLNQWKPVSVGKVLRPWHADDDLLEEMRDVNA